MKTLKRPTSLQLFLSTFAGYDSFILFYCPTMFNAFANIGYLGMLGLFTFSTAGFVFGREVYNLTSMWSLLCSMLIVVIMAICFRLTTSLQHRFNNQITLIFIILLSIPMSLIVGYGFSLWIFKSEMLIYSLSHGKHIVSWSDRILLLFDFFLNGNEKGGVVAIFSCIAIFVTFLLSIPFILIYHYRNSIYYKTLQVYAQDFYEN